MTAPRIEIVPYDDPRAAALRTAQRRELDDRYGSNDHEPGTAPSAADTALFLIAVDDDGRPVGCGGLRRLDDTSGEVKRMFVTPDTRRGGVASRVLAALEEHARAFGWTHLRLETGTLQPEAIAFYQRHGYAEIPLFGEYAGSTLSRCFEKALADPGGDVAAGRSGSVGPPVVTGGPTHGLG